MLAAALPGFYGAWPSCHAVLVAQCWPSETVICPGPRELGSWVEFLFGFAAKLWSVLVARIEQRPAWAQLRTCHHPLDLVYSFCKNSFSGHSGSLMPSKTPLTFSYTLDRSIRHSQRAACSLEHRAISRPSDCGYHKVPTCFSALERHALRLGQSSTLATSDQSMILRG